MARFYVPFRLTVGDEYALPDGVIRHFHVRRIRADDQVELFNGDGFVYSVQIECMAKREITVRVITQNKANNESPLEIILAQSISSGERMDFTLQKSVELGVNQIYPLATQRSIVQLNDTRAEKKVARWQEIVVSACEQSGRAVVPEVYGVQSLAQFLQQLPDAEVYLLLSPVGAKKLKTIVEAYPAPRRVCVLIGPEGGLTPEEEERAMAAGFLPILLGERILRTETASLAVVSAMQILWGDFL